MKILLTFLSLIALSFSVFAEKDGVKPGTSPSVQTEPVQMPAAFEAVRFEDMMNGTNDVAGLQSRGWIVRNHDGGGTTDPWYNPPATAPFTAYEGANYVASNYSGANGFYIDQWLISPVIQVAAGDTLSFWHRSPDGNTWDDSLWVKFSASGDTAMSSFTALGSRFRTGESGWEQKVVVLPSAGFVRFAIQYQIFDGGPSGNQSNFLGVDAIRVSGTGIVPVELTSFAANAVGDVVNLNWATATETNNKGFEVQKLVNGQFTTVGFVNGKGTTTEKQNYSYSEKAAAGSHTYRLKQLDYNGTYAYSDEVNVDVRVYEFALAQNYPNPFNPSTKISFNLKVDSKVSLKVFNILGQEVAQLVNKNIAAGSHTVNFDASKLNSGVYVYKIEAKGIDGQSFSSVKKMLLTK